MPGTERSGRRKLESPTGIKLPGLGTTEKSIRKYLARVARAVIEQGLDPRYADTLIAAAKGALQAMRQEHSRNEVDELRAMVEQAKETLRSARKRVSDERDKLDAPVGADGADSRTPAATPDK